MKKSITFFAFFFCFTISFSQNLVGNMMSTTENNLSYGNVDIYRGNEKVASVLTDVNGNFNVKLDTGIYRVELQYDGYKKVIEEIELKSDKRADFKLKADKSMSSEKSKKKDELTSVYSEDLERRMLFSDGVAVQSIKDKRTSETSGLALGGESKLMRAGEFASLDNTKHTVHKQSTRHGILTAGEINDFAKWDLWTDIVSDELQEYQAFWKIEPKQRYVVQLTNEDQLPVVNAIVQLIDESGNVIFQGRSDNTGKAELWGSLTSIMQQTVNFSALIYHSGKEFSIRNLKPFKRGINQKSISVDCKQSKMVDIAFVVDATGSMGDEINFLREELNDVIYKTKNANPSLTFNFANTFYRDQGESYVTKHQDFSPVLSKSINFINEQNARGGGDYEEAVDVALDECINDLSWSNDARARLLFLILDAPPRNSPEIRTKLDAIIRQSAAQGIRIIPLVASGINKDAEYLMRCISLATNGTYAFLTSHSGIGGEHIEPSTDEYEVELLNDLMIRIISSYIFVPDCDTQLDEDSFEDFAEEQSEGEEDEEKLEWSYWPNPTKGIINIKVYREIPEMFLTDLSGKILERYADLDEHRTIRRDLSQYAKGLYLLTFMHNEKNYTGKIVLH
jgi:hypothetical protein